MCWEDVRIARQVTQAETRGVVVAGTATKISDQDDTRFSIIIGPPDLGNVYISTVRPSAVGQGVKMGIASNPLTLTLAEYASMVTGELWAISDAPPSTVGVIDNSLLEKS